MKQLTWNIFVLDVFILLWCCSSAYSGMVLTTGLRYDSFGGDPADGTELTIPVGFAYEWDKVFCFGWKALTVRRM